MAAAFGWGILAASSLVIGAVVALRFRIGLRVIGLILAFGAGVLISAVAFDLVEEAVSKSGGHGAAVAGLFAGCAVFFGGDWLIDRFGGADRKDADGGQANGSALAIVLGTVLERGPRVDGDRPDDLPGRRGGRRLPDRGVHLQPARIDLLHLRPAAGGWAKSRILWMWIAIAVISGLASLAGYGLFQHSSPGTVAFVLAFAAGAILTMLADTMMPEAHQHGGKLTGVVTTLGFAIAATIHLLD